MSGLEEVGELVVVHIYYVYVLTDAPAERGPASA